jgi:dTDP-4-dehydrorhamnose reductase
MKRAWITGAGGLIGSYLAKTKSPEAAQFEIIPLGRQTLDIINFGAVERWFGTKRPDLIIHCAALSKTPDCQAMPQVAKVTNVAATAHLAQLASEVDFIFFSTDLVFDGRKGDYVETDAVNPLSVYGETKVEAEQIVLANPRHTVVRTSLNSGISPSGKSAYNEQLLAGWKAGKSIKFFFDEYRCPISAQVTARAIWELAAKRATGLYHLAGSERLSRADIATLAAARHPELQVKIETCSSKEYEGAPRPWDTSLNCAKIQKLLSFPLPGLTDYLRDHPEESF